MTAPNPNGKAEFQDFPLSSAQARLWFLEQMQPGLAAYNVPEAWRLRGPLDIPALGAAFQELVCRHETLRTRFPAQRGEPVQQILRQIHFEVALRRTPENELAPNLADEARQPFSLSAAPLIRATLFEVDSQDHVLLVTLHHIICDDWSLGVLFQDLAALYQKHTGSGSGDLSPLPLQYADFAVWQRSRDQQDSLKKSLEYWVKHLSGCAPSLSLAADRPRPTQSSGKGETLFREVPKEVLLPFKRICGSHHVTLFSGLLAAFNSLVYRYTNQTDLMIGSVFAGRDQVELEGLIGFLANTHALRTQIDPNEPFSNLLGRTQENALASGTHQEVPFDHIVREVCPDRAASVNPLFQMLFALQPNRANHLDLPGVKSERIEVPSGGAKFDLALLATESSEGLSLRCEYSSDLYDPPTVHRILRHYENILRGVGASPNQLLRDIRFLDAEEERLVIHDWNNTGRKPVEDSCLHELFERQANATPASLAIVDAEEQVTYEELDQRSGRIARHLRSRGLRPEEPVGICLHRSAGMIAALLGVLKAGGCYVPLDPAYPAERLSYMLQDAGCRFVLRNSKSPPIASDAKRTEICLEELLAAEPGTSQNICAPKPDQLSHIIFTSGSTGRPKGVALEHRNAVALVRWAQTVYTPDEVSGVLAATSICFDLSVFEMFVPLSMGGTVILAQNALELPKLAARDQVTLINTVPSAIRELLRLKAIPASTRVINLAGEPLSTELVDRIYAGTPVEKVYDLYGPTETTTYSTFALRAKGAAATIGRPLAGERAYVLDDALRPVSIGVAGELYLAGPGVARGYYRNPEATQARFIPDPFVGGERMYRTGDSARWRADGTLVYLGRLDQQVKLRGYRIEPGEIEAILRRHAGVRDALVTLREDRAGDPRLIAYIVVSDGATIPDGELQEVLRARLPAFMIPSAFVPLTAIPLTPNGKVDRAALPAPGLPRPNVVAPVVPPSTPTEEKLMAIWREVLGRNSFGVTDNFFELGGHSLLATQITSRIASTFNVDLPLSAIFEHPTIETLSAAALAAPRRSEDALIPRRMRRADVDRMLGQLDCLDEAELEKLLQQTGLTISQ